MTNYISGRVRLARNLSSYPFPSKMTAEQASEVITKVWEALNSSALKDTLTLIRNDENPEKLALLSEKHLVSQDLLRSQLPSAVILSSDEKISIMINEEDHIRIQVFADSDTLDDAFDTADKLDSLLCEKLDIAYHEKFGFLTACPTNAGTGLRASFMLHLPALTMSNSISNVLSWAGKLSLAVRGIYGEGSKAKGAFYQLSNQVTLGATEKDIINRVNLAAKELSEKESMVRETIYENNKIKITDRCMRSYGLLTNAYTISSDEAFSLASDVQMGIGLGIIKSISTKQLTEALFSSLPLLLSEKYALDKPTATERDIHRAKHLRESLTL